MDCAVFQQENLATDRAELMRRAPRAGTYAEIRREPE